MRKILVFGGTRFFGKELVKALIENGDDVTILTRGVAKDEFCDKIKRIHLDKRDEKGLKEALKGKRYDVVYDNICYSPNDADRICRLLKNKTKKYIVISSIAVYLDGENMKETEFNPNIYKITMGERENFSYAEGKRLMEAVLYKNASFPCISVRFPVVIGKDDYTNRLKTYVEKVKNNETIHSNKLDLRMNMITQNEAGIFLVWLGYKDINAPINAACNGDISLREIISIIEEETKKEAIIDESKNDEKTSPYNNQLNKTIDIINIMELGGYRFKDIRSELRETIREYI